MASVPFYIITSDATSDILPVTCYLYNKYWQTGDGQQFTILGNHPPKAMLPDNFKFVRIKQDNDIQKWTRYLHDFIIGQQENGYFVLTLDDYLPNAPLKEMILDQLLTHVDTHEHVGRVALGRFHPTRLALSRAHVEHWENLRTNEANLVRLLPDTLYRLSCQTSIWNRDYFAKYFSNNWSPWQLELEGSRLAKNDGWEIIGTSSQQPFSWVEESALSGRWPGMVNILGMKPEDVAYCIGQGWFDPDKLQYGIWYESRIPFVSRFQSLSKKLTKIPKFSDIGYDFKWSMIKPYVRARTFEKLYKHYKDIYPAS